MVNEFLIRECLRMLRDRSEYWENAGEYGRCVAYESAADMLEYALDDNAECLAQYDTCRKD